MMDYDDPKHFEGIGVGGGVSRIAFF